MEQVWQNDNISPGPADLPEMVKGDFPEPICYVLGAQKVMWGHELIWPKNPATSMNLPVLRTPKTHSGPKNRFNIHPSNKFTILILTLPKTNITPENSQKGNENVF